MTSRHRSFKAPTTKTVVLPSLSTTDLPARVDQCLSRLVTLVECRVVVLSVPLIRVLKLPVRNDPTVVLAAFVGEAIW